MSDHLITLFTTIIAALSALFAAYKAWRVGSQVQEIHLSMNSRMDEMLKLARSESAATAHAAGMEEGRAAGLASGEEKAHARSEGVIEGQAKLATPE